MVGAMVGRVMMPVRIAPARINSATASAIR